MILHWLLLCGKKDTDQHAKPMGEGRARNACCPRNVRRNREQPSVRGGRRSSAMAGASSRTVRSDSLRHMRQALRGRQLHAKVRMVARGGIEPPTSAL